MPGDVFELAAGVRRDVLAATRGRGAPEHEASERPGRVAAILDPAEAFDRIVRRAQTVIPLSLGSINAACGGGIGGADVLVVVGPPRSAKSTLLFWIGLAVARATGRRLYIYAPDQGALACFRWLKKVVADAPDPAAAIRELVVVVDEGKEETDLDSFERLVIENRDDVAAVLLDSAQTLLAPGAKDETARVTAAMTTAKRLGDALVVPIFVTSQANRASWRSARNEERSSPLSAGLNGSAIEYRATIHIFSEKVSKRGEPPRFRLSVAKSAHGQDDLDFQLVLDPERMEFSEVEAVDEEQGRSDDEARRWKDLADEALEILQQRWTASETPSVRDLGARLRAARAARGLRGPNNDRLADLVAYLEKVGAVCLNRGPRNSIQVSRPARPQVPE